MTKQKRQLLKGIQLLLMTVYLVLIFDGGYQSLVITISQSIVFFSALLLNYIPEKKQQFQPLFFKYYWLDAVAQLTLMFLLVFLILQF
ncbi:hypothetical protein [Enterococcus rivorum]|uniref:Uncharacterized protein n=1 Tax=Enterococcus rivorum TaxID=762845 RepID=A0A1E5KT25_9ENTE|nr:hypothetical protein [Enterococcus rivorum]MBP2098147.1 hypothetical protein [Enterococcus rivorum]OEH80928.1 hypothetical protein BCR26_06775 [Enterococcus rivorum]